MQLNRDKQFKNKLHSGEFVEYVFTIAFSLLKEIDAKRKDAFVDHF